MATQKAALSKARRDEAAVRPATIVALSTEPGRVRVRASSGSGGGRTLEAEARLAVAAPYRAAEGDRVLLAGGDDELYVIGVLHTKSPPTLPLPGGGSVAVIGEGVEIRDEAGRLLVRYAGGSAEIAAPDGDLTLAAPLGRVVLRSGTDIDVEAARLSVRTDESHIITGQATLLAQRITTTASVLSQSVERFELTATRLVERTRDAFRETADLAQTRAGRMRTLVKDVCSIYSRRTVMASREDTSIDGSKILLG